MTPLKVKKVKKPWGGEIWYAYGNGRYVGKIITVKKGRRLSLQYHEKKHETVYVLKGRLSLVIGKNKKRKTLGPGQGWVIPAKTVHRFEAPRGEVTLLEASTPEVWDAVRIEDDYGRAG